MNNTKESKTLTNGALEKVNRDYAEWFKTLKTRPIAGLDTITDFVKVKKCRDSQRFH